MYISLESTKTEILHTKFQISIILCSEINMEGGGGEGDSFYPHETNVHKIELSLRWSAIILSKCSIQFLKMFPYKKKLTLAPKFKDKTNEI